MPGLPGAKGERAIGQTGKKIILYFDYDNVLLLIQVSKELLVNQVFQVRQDYPEVLVSVDFQVAMVRKILYVNYLCTYFVF